MTYDVRANTLTDDHHHRLHLRKAISPGDPPPDFHLYLDWMSCFKEQPQGGKVTGGGNKGMSDQNFGFNIQQDFGSPPKGELEYQDKVAGINFHSERYSGLVVFRDMTPMRAIFWGFGTINGDQQRPFVVAVTDADEPGAGADTFRITIFGSSQTVSGQLINGGNIQIHK